MLDFFIDVFEGSPPGLDVIHIRRVGREVFQGAADFFDACTNAWGLMETRVVDNHDLTWDQFVHEALIDPALKYVGGAITFEAKRSDEPMVVERGDDGSSSRSFAWALAQQKLALSTPPTRQAGVVVNACFVDKNKSA